MNLFEELTAILSTLESEKVDYALCGGLAMAVYAFPRATLDIDLMIDRADLEKVKSIAGRLGFGIDAGLMTFKEGKVQIHRLTQLDAEAGEPLALDLLLVSAETRDVWESRRRIEWDRGELSVVSPEGLIKLKSIRNSGQDRDDIERLRGLIDEA